MKIGERFKADAFTELARTGGVLRDRIAGRSITLRCHSASQNSTIRNETDEPLPGVVAFWFAWNAFHSDTEVFKARP